MSKKVQKYPICNVCNEERKPVQLSGGRKKTMARACLCGAFTTEGKQIISYTD